MIKSTHSHTGHRLLCLAYRRSQGLPELHNNSRFRSGADPRGTERTKSNPNQLGQHGMSSIIPAGRNLLLRLSLLLLLLSFLFGLLCYLLASYLFLRYFSTAAAAAFVILFLFFLRIICFILVFIFDTAAAMLCRSIRYC